MLMKQQTREKSVVSGLRTIGAVGFRMQSTLAEEHCLLVLLSCIDDPGLVVQASARQMLRGAARNSLRLWHACFPVGLKHLQNLLGFLHNPDRVADTVYLERSHRKCQFLCVQGMKLQ